MTVLEIKKYFTKNTSVNFLNDFTLQDVEDAKKMIFTKYYKTHGESLKTYLDNAAEKLAKDRFYAGIKEDQGVAVKNTVRDVLNANYKNTITRLILVDSQFRPQLTDYETNFLIQLNQKVVNAVSLELINIQIPYTFYNIEPRQGNDHFNIYNKTTGEHIEITLTQGHYKSIDNMIQTLNAQLSILGNISFKFTDTASNNIEDSMTKKPSLHNETDTDYTIQFLTKRSKINNCLGWHLGFRTFQGSNISNQYITMDYELPGQGTITADAVATVPHIKYFIVVVEDFNNNQTTDTMVQSNIKQENSKPSTYFTQDPYLSALTPDNLTNYLETIPHRTLTKSQLYTIAQQNQEKINLGLQNTRLDVHAPNQVLAMIPFEESKAHWGSLYFADKNKYLREYHSPTTLDRLQVKLYDDKGYLLNLNGSNWCMTLLTNNLYKY